MLESVLLVLGAYLLGSVPAAYLAARWSKGVDIRRYGSGNVGASNVAEVVSRKLMVPVILFDIAKGFLPVYIARTLGMGAVVQIIAGLAAISGHNWPVYLRFAGGRGIATTLGVILALVPLPTVIALSLALLLGLFHHLALGTLLALVSLPLLSWFLGPLLAVTERGPMTLGLLAILLLAVFRRLTAPRTSLTHTVPRSELLINRFLFDRDIRDRKAWIHRDSPSKPEAG